MLKPQLIRLTTDIANRLDRMAVAYGMSKANIIRQILEDYLDEFERRQKGCNEQKEHFEG